LALREIIYEAIIDEQIGKLEIIVIGLSSTRLGICPTWKKGRLQTAALFNQRGPPNHWLKKLKEQ
jgi:hypothetical protein